MVVQEGRTCLNDVEDDFHFIVK